MKSDSSSSRGLRPPASRGFCGLATIHALFIGFTTRRWQQRPARRRFFVPTVAYDGRCKMRDWFLAGKRSATARQPAAVWKRFKHKPGWSVCNVAARRWQTSSPRASFPRRFVVASAGGRVGAQKPRATASSL
ncbi:unnamed protein product [Chondrus crispus]|uniref:Uncharacterized protein n=1 Tax=Chondrus crispus TaxID=2769 RepID=R7Q911_CHOCR|nr:unnamed protein product [Chondrus crispus]CDF34303.1 unnamed protein product [Chondrus crispus]|eukprot:XP_005714122.1 unnamed protein product [Chondrus crispus]